MIRLSNTMHKNGSNLHWRLELIRGNKLKTIISNDKKANYINPNSYCEIYWKGPAEKNGILEYISEYTLIGYTGTKENTISPIFNREKDGTVLELPPVWTELDIPRGQYENHYEENGGWVAKNQLPTPINNNNNQEDKNINTSNKTKNNNNNSSKNKNMIVKSEEEIKNMRILIKYNDILNKEVAKQLEMLRYVNNKKYTI